MSNAAATLHPSPHRHRVHIWMPMFGMIAPPFFWVGQFLLGYWISALTCTQANAFISANAAYRGFLFLSIVAAIGALSAGAVALVVWRTVRQEKAGGPSHALEAGEGRTRFMALWGMLSCLWFLGAIVFTAVGTLTVPPCPV